MNTKELRIALTRSSNILEIKSIIHELLDYVEDEEAKKILSRKPSQEPTIYDAIVDVIPLQARY